ncbi:MAG TPA: hypothetical protein VNU68_18870 [Verrucomicrobiae bacterium]|nr:hypothetical protein [Verrucomicrobiae bacterium]
MTTRAAVSGLFGANSGRRFGRLLWHGMWAALLHGALMQVTAGAPPTLHGMQPMGVSAGRSTGVILSGENLAGTLELWTSFPAVATADERSQETAFNLTVPAGTQVGLGLLRSIGTNGISNPLVVLLDPLTAMPATGTNHTPFTAQTVKVPGAVDGFCAEVSSDFYRFSGRSGQQLTIEVVAKRIGSALDPFLRVLNLERRELAAIDDTPGLQGDARLDFRCPRTEDYLVEVRDTQYGGGREHRYRLRLGRGLPYLLPFPVSDRYAANAAPRLPQGIEREPNNGPIQVQQLSWPVELEGAFNRSGDRDVYQFFAAQGDTLWVQGRTRSLSWPCDLLLQLQTTNGLKLAEANASGSDEGMLTNRFAEAGTYRLVVEELNRQGGPRCRYRLQLQPLLPGFTLSVETERISVPAGESFPLLVQAQRRDYDGPITLALPGLDSGFGLTNAVIPAKTNAVQLTVTTPAHLELGDFFDFRVSGQATIQERKVVAQASTLPAIRRVLPNLRYPPAELDGVITLSIASGRSGTVPPTRKKRNAP